MEANPAAITRGQVKGRDVTECSGAARRSKQFQEIENINAHDNTTYFTGI